LQKRLPLPAALLHPETYRISILPKVRYRTTLPKTTFTRKNSLVYYYYYIVLKYDVFIQTKSQNCFDFVFAFSALIVFIQAKAQNA
jgi:hypothetical protein